MQGRGLPADRRRGGLAPTVQLALTRLGLDVEVREAHLLGELNGLLRNAVTGMTVPDHHDPEASTLR